MWLTLFPVPRGPWYPQVSTAALLSRRDGVMMSSLLQSMEPRIVCTRLVPLLVLCLMA